MPNDPADSSRSVGPAGLPHIPKDREFEPPQFLALDRAWTLAMQPWRERDGPLVVLFSGGVDSGLIAWELAHRPGTNLFTVGCPGSHDLASARAAAVHYPLAWVSREVVDSELAQLRDRLSQELRGLRPAEEAIFLSLGAAVQWAPPGPLLCGQGADELFLGYAHFRRLDPGAAAERAASDLNRLREVDWPRTERIASILGRQISSPFLSPPFVEAAQDVPVELRLPDPVPKALLRQWAQHRGLPADLAGPPKRAFQYGSGIARWLRGRSAPGAASEPGSPPPLAGPEPARGSR